ncbi:MAG: hypothetical protein ABI036_13835 [Fibrobacteria bacterium]
MAPNTLSPLFPHRLFWALFIPLILATHAAAIEVKGAGYSYTLPAGWITYSYGSVTLDDNWMTYGGYTSLVPSLDSTGGNGKTAEMIMDNIVASTSKVYTVVRRSAKNIGGRPVACLETTFPTGDTFLWYYHCLTVQGDIRFDLTMNSKKGETRPADMESALATLNLAGVNAGIRSAIRVPEPVLGREERDILGRRPLDARRIATPRFSAL